MTPHDHVGWLLWEASRLWKSRLTAAMIDAGFPWYGEGRGALLRYIGHEGVAQGDLAARAGLTKQAVQQHVDALVADGVAERAPCPSDARRRIVRLTRTGHAALDASDRIKVVIETHYRARLGARRMAALRETLEALAEDGDAAAS